MPWDYGVDPTKHPCYQHVVDCKYWTMLVSFNNWNIIKLTSNTKLSKDFDVVHKVVIYVISENMASLVKLGKYGTTNTADSTTMVYYVMKYLYEPCTLQEDQIIYVQVSKAYGIILKSE